MDSEAHSGADIAPKDSIPSEEIANKFIAAVNNNDETQLNQFIKHYENEDIAAIKQDADNLLELAIKRENFTFAKILIKTGKFKLFEPDINYDEVIKLNNIIQNNLDKFSDQAKAVEFISSIKSSALCKAAEDNSVEEAEELAKIFDINIESDANTLAYALALAAQNCNKDLIFFFIKEKKVDLRHKISLKGKSQIEIGEFIIFIIDQEKTAISKSDRKTPQEREDQIKREDKFLKQIEAIIKQHNTITAIQKEVRTHEETVRTCEETVRTHEKIMKKHQKQKNQTQATSSLKLNEKIKNIQSLKKKKIKIMLITAALSIGSVTIFFSSKLFTTITNVTQHAIKNTSFAKILAATFTFSTIAFGITSTLFYFNINKENNYQTRLLAANKLDTSKKEREKNLQEARNNHTSKVEELKIATDNLDKERDKLRNHILLT